MVIIFAIDHCRCCKSLTLPKFFILLLEKFWLLPKYFLVTAQKIGIFFIGSPVLPPGMVMDDKTSYNSETSWIKQWFKIYWLYFLFWNWPCDGVPDSLYLETVPVELLWWKEIISHTFINGNYFKSCAVKIEQVIKTELIHKKVVWVTFKSATLSILLFLLTFSLIRGCHSGSCSSIAPCFWRLHQLITKT